MNKKICINKSMAFLVLAGIVVVSGAALMATITGKSNTTDTRASTVKKNVGECDPIKCFDGSVAYYQKTTGVRVGNDTSTHTYEYFSHRDCKAEDKIQQFSRNNYCNPPKVNERVSTKKIIKESKEVLNPPSPNDVCKQLSSTPNTSQNYCTFSRFCLLGLQAEYTSNCGITIGDAIDAFCCVADTETTASKICQKNGGPDDYCPPHLAKSCKSGYTLDDSVTSACNVTSANINMYCCRKSSK